MKILIQLIGKYIQAFGLIFIGYGIGTSDALSVIGGLMATGVGYIVEEVAS